MYHIFVSFSYNFYLMLQAQQRGRQPTPTHNWQVDGTSLMEWWDFTVQWSVRQPLARNLEPLRLREPTERTTDHWGAFTPFRRAGSAEQLQSAGDEQAPSVRDDVTEHEREESW